MKTRIFTSILIVAIAIPTFLLSEYIVYPIVLAALSGAAMFELLRVLGCHNRPAISIPSYCIGVTLPVCAYFVREWLTCFLLVCVAVIYAFLLYLFMVSIFSRGKIKFSRIAGVFCTVSYATLAFTALCAIRYIENGVFLFGLVFIASWVSDVFALLVGTLLGRHKLIPEISPKKTVEGLIGGVVFATLAMLLYGLIIDCFFADKSVNYLILASMGVGLSLLSQLGDLIASTIKREEGVKDYGTILPGHGGITDRFDSIFAISVLTLIICVVFPPIV